jgi:glutamate-5-semialdehyde dehydrogenase
MKDIIQQIHHTKVASYQIAKLSSKDKKKLLLEMADCLKKHEKDIIEANQRDIVAAKKRRYSSAFLDRLTLINSRRGSRA